MSDSTRCWNASPCLRPGLLTRARFPWPALGNLREEPSAGKPHARIRGGESRMAELPDRILVDRLRRPAEVQLDTVPIRPVIERLRGELCAVVDADALGQRPRGRDV